LQAKSGVEVESTEIALAFPLSDKFWKLNIINIIFGKLLYKVYR
jgi:hypothetical protein